MTSDISPNPEDCKIMAIGDTYQEGSWWCKAIKEWYDGRKRWCMGRQHRCLYVHGGRGLFW